jgi:flagellar FliL protein
VTRAFQPLITNITMPADIWVRLEGAIVYDQAEVDEPDIMLAEVSGDLLAYLRSLTLREMQGADGLMFVRQDMRERLALRTNGKARDIIIQTLVVQ